MASPPAAKPANTPASPRFSCILSSSDATCSTYLDTTNAAPHSTSPHRPCPPDDDPTAASHTPGSHPCGTTCPPAAFRKAAGKSPRCDRQSQIGPPTAVRLRYHRRPDPHILPLAPPPSSHLVKSNHRRRPGAYYAGSPLCAPAAHPGTCNGPSFLTYLLTAGTLTPKMRAMALNELPSWYIAGARSLSAALGL